MSKFNASSMVGETPLLKIEYRFKGEIRAVFAKAEYFNYTGSIKDRVASYILSEALSTGELTPEMEIMEATSGNMGISFAAFGRAMGHDVKIFIPSWMSVERINLIRSFGAKVRLVSADEGGFLGSISMAEQEKKENPSKVFLPRQFDNIKNCEAHERSTGPEIAKQLNQLGLVPDAFVAGVGTGGTVMGVGSYLRTINEKVKIFPLEPTNSPTLSTGYKVGKHRIQGISDEFIPSILRLDKLDQVIQVDDGDSIIMAQKLAKTLGLGVGISSGANFLGAVLAQNMLGRDAVVATIFADDNKKYLTTDYGKEEPIKENFLSGDIEILGLDVIRLHPSSSLSSSSFATAFRSPAPAFRSPIPASRSPIPPWTFSRSPTPASTSSGPLTPSAASSRPPTPQTQIHTVPFVESDLASSEKSNQLTDIDYPVAFRMSKADFDALPDSTKASLRRNELFAK